MMQALYDHLPLFGQNLACTYAGYQRAKSRYTPYFEETLARWQNNLHCTEDELYRIQRQRLDALIQHARKNVPYFRSLPPPSTARDDRTAIAETLAQIPILEKAELTRSGEALRAVNLSPKQQIRGKTSGTTGSALAFYYTPESLAEEHVCIWRQRLCAGAQRNDWYFSFGGQMLVPFAQSKPPFWRTNYYSKQILFSLYHMTPENLVHYGNALHALPGKYIQGYPSSLYLMAQSLLEQGRPLPRGKLLGIFSSSESLLAFHRETIEKAFHAPIYDRYGVSEFAASMTQCSHQRLHVDMEFGIVEVEAVEETDTYLRGPLLVTGLGNFAQPFLRYRIGDVGTRLKKASCPCGRAGEMFLDVDGRIEDAIITPDDRQIGRLDHIFKLQTDVVEAQILQHRKDRIEVLLVVRPSYNATSEQSLLREFHSRLGDAMQIEFRKVAAIPREANGKFRAVKSFLGKDAVQ